MRLITGRSVLTGRLDHPEVANGGVVVDSASIVDIGDAAGLRRTYPHATEIDGPDFIVMPGLVSAHQHGGGVSSVQLGCLDRPFESWLLATFGIAPLHIRLDTTLHSHYTRDPDRYVEEVDEILAGHADAGIRVAFEPCFMDRNLLTYSDDDAFLAAFPTDLSTAAPGISVAGILTDAYVPFVTDLARRLGGDEMRTILFGPVAPEWSSAGMLEAIGAAMRAGVSGVHTHLLETRGQPAYLDTSLGRSIVTALEEWGLLGPAAPVAHGVYLTSEMEHLAATGTTVVANPGCNLRLGNGTPPMGASLAAGPDIAIGTDDMTVGDDDDLLGELRLLRSLARSSGAWPDASKWMHVATGAGARAVGLDHLIGSLEIGKRADVVLLDAMRLTEPYADVNVSEVELFHARARGSGVASVLVATEVVLEDGRHRSIDRLALTSALGDVAAVQLRNPARRARAAAMASLAEARTAWPDGCLGGM